MLYLIALTAFAKPPHTAMVVSTEMPYEIDLGRPTTELTATVDPPDALDLRTTLDANKLVVTGLHPGPAKLTLRDARNRVAQVVDLTISDEPWPPSNTLLLQVSIGGGQLIQLQQSPNVAFAVDESTAVVQDLGRGYIWVIGKSEGRTGVVLSPGVQSPDLLYAVTVAKDAVVAQDVITVPIGGMILQDQPDAVLTTATSDVDKARFMPIGADKVSLVGVKTGDVDGAIVYKDPNIPPRLVTVRVVDYPPAPAAEALVIKVGETRNLTGMPGTGAYAANVDLVSAHFDTEAKGTLVLTGVKPGYSQVMTVGDDGKAHYYDVYVQE